MLLEDREKAVAQLRKQERDFNGSYRFALGRRPGDPGSCRHAADCTGIPCNTQLCPPRHPRRTGVSSPTLLQAESWRRSTSGCKTRTRWWMKTCSVLRKCGSAICRYISLQLLCLDAEACHRPSDRPPDHRPTPHSLTTSSLAGRSGNLRQVANGVPLQSAGAADAGVQQHISNSPGGRPPGTTAAGFLGA